MSAPFKELIFPSIDNIFLVRIFKYAVKTYKALIMSEFHPQYIVEYCYYQVMLAQNENSENKNDINSQVIGLVDNYLQSQALTSEQIDNLDELRHSLSSDNDLNKVITQDTLDHIKTKLGTLTD